MRISRKTLVVADDLEQLLMALRDQGQTLAAGPLALTLRLVPLDEERAGSGSEGRRHPLIVATGVAPRRALRADFRASASPLRATNHGLPTGVI